MTGADFGRWGGGDKCRLIWILLIIRIPSDSHQGWFQARCPAAKKKQGWFTHSFKGGCLGGGEGGGMGSSVRKAPQTLSPLSPV